MSAPQPVPMAGGVAFGLGVLAAVVLGPAAPSWMLGAGVFAGSLVLAVGAATVVDEEAIAVANVSLAAAVAGFVALTVPIAMREVGASGVGPALPCWSLLGLALVTALAGAWLRRRRREALARS